MSDMTDALIEEIERLLAEERHDALRARLADHHPADLATAVSGLERSQQLTILSILDAPLAAQVLAELDDLSSKHLVRDLPEERLSALIGEMSPQTAVGLLEHLAEEERSRVVATLAHRMRSQVRRRLVHPEDSAGRIMDARTAQIRIDLSVAEATEILRRRFGDRESIATVFVVDEEGRLVGQVSPLRLLLADPDQPVDRIVRRDLPGIPPEMDQEEVAKLAVRYDLVALPVVDDENRLLGMVSFDDVFDVIEEEDTEDLSYAAGTGTDSPTDRLAARAIRARLPWLLLGLTGGLGSAAVLSHFESALDRAVTLAFFVPAVLGLAGAVAVQSSSLMVRGLASGSIGIRRLPRIALRELRVSIGMGLALGALLGLAGFFSSGGDATLGWLLFLVMVLVLITAAIGGTVIPLILENLGVDAAVAMGPFVTTLSDIVALSIYMGIASMLID